MTRPLARASIASQRMPYAISALPTGTEREAIRDNLRQFIDKGFTAHHDVVEYWDSPLLKVFHGKVAMKFDDPSIKPVRPTMTHFFYMDENAPTKVKHWVGAVGPTGF